MPSSPRALDCRDLGILSYSQGLDEQKKFHAKRVALEIPDTALLLEHRHVITLGKRGSDGDILAPLEALSRDGVEIVHSDRGGQTTYHGPGQLVCYLIFHLHEGQRRIRDLVSNIELSIIEYLKTYHGIEGHVEAEHPGVWVGAEKVAALGISIHDKVTMHGLALNVNTDLRWFEAIIPCGIRDRPTTSIEKLTGLKSDMAAVKRDFAAVLGSVFGFESVNWLAGAIAD